MVIRRNSYVNLKTVRGDRARSAAALLTAAAKRLQRSGVEAPDREAQWLLAHAWRRPRARLLAGLADPVPALARRAFRKLLARRAAHVPLQYLLGAETFADLELRVGPGVLIPRPETELLLQEALRRVPPRAGDFLADLGAGSGNLSLALARHSPHARVIGVEVSPAALRWARLNRRRYPARNLRLVLGKAPAAIPARLHGHFRLVVANPPYIPTHELKRLQPEVRHEPRLALDGGPDGLEGLRDMSAAAARLLQPGGVLVAEIGIGQAAAARRILAAAGFGALQSVPDWQKIPRILSGRLDRAGCP